MIVNRLKSGLLILVLLGASLSFAQTQNEVTELNDKEANPLYQKFVPDYLSLQFAGNIGFVSAGLGYQLFSNRLNTELVYGFVPKHEETKAIHQITLKNTVPLFRFQHENLLFTPMLGLTAGYETGRHSFVRLPERFSDGYYRTNAFHFTFLLALNVHKDLKPSYAIKAFDFYYEIGSVDTYLWYGISNKEVKMNEIFSSALGVRLYF